MIKGKSFKPATVVYLAGGMKSNWQDIVKKEFPEVVFFDPRDHNCKSEQEYTRWDLTGVEKCDIVFAFLENSNPAGQGLCVEVGFARALEKYVIYLEEPRDNARYFGMCRVISDFVSNEENCLQAGITHLRELLKSN